MGGGFDHFLIAVDFRRGKAHNVLPGVAGQDAGGMAEAQLRVGLFQINLYRAVGPHIRMNNLRVVIQGQKGIS